MNIANKLIHAGERLGSFLVHFAHGAMLTLGLLSIAALMASVIEPQALRALPLSPIAEARASLAPTLVVEAIDFEPDTNAPEALAEAPVAATSRVKRSESLTRVRAYVARRYRVSETALHKSLVRAQVSGAQLGLDPLLIVAVMAIESSFNPMAESTVGAQGLMQVIPRFHMEKIGPDATPESLFDPETNVRVGALVIKEGIRRYGSIQRGLQYYGGALKDPEARYAKKVLAMQARLSKIADDA